MDCMAQAHTHAAPPTGHPQLPHNRPPETPSARRNAAPSLTCQQEESKEPRQIRDFLGAVCPGGHGPQTVAGVTVPRGTVTPQHSPEAAQRKALLLEELRRALE